MLYLVKNYYLMKPYSFMLGALAPSYDSDKYYGG